MKTYNERMESVQKKLRQKQIRRRTVTVTAGALCLCIILGVLFMPYDKGLPNVDKHAGSDYYKVIQAINKLTYQKPQYDNLFDKLVSDDRFWVENDFANSGALEMPPVAVPEAAPGMKPNYSAGTNENTNSSVEITDHQVAGVHEGDLIKRSETQIFYLNGKTLEVYPIAGEETKLLTRWTLSLNEKVYYSNAEMYLSADATRLTIVISGFGVAFRESKTDSFVQMISLDVSDPANIKESGQICITGNLLSSRMIGNQLMVMAQFRMDNTIDFDDEATFLPQYGTPGNMQSIPAEDIVIPEELTNRYYTVVALLDSPDLSFVDAGAFMSYSAELYVSKEHIYATRTYTETKDLAEGIRESKTMTEVSCMAYSPEGLACKGTFCVEGSVKDQYSMDEHEGVFRIVTATNRRVIKSVWSPDSTADANGNTAQSNVSMMPAVSQNANLTCFKVGSWEQVAQVAQFAPDGETVESVRFDGDYAYVCTAVVVTLTDPVFFFDMTDLDNIIVKDTGTIDGYSSSLIQLNDGFLMGIGYNDKLNLKVEIYEETETGVVSVCEYIKVDRFAIDYKAYYIDRENNLFGIPTGTGYILLQFNGYQLNLLAESKTTQGYSITELDYFRGVVVDKCLYVFGPLHFSVQEIG